MIVDCHTHIWQSPDQLGQMDLGGSSRKTRATSSKLSPNKSSWRTLPAGDPANHWAQSGTVDKSFVLGFKSRYLRADIPNRFVADYVKRSLCKLIGFAGVDPTESSALEELKIARDDLHLRQLKRSEEKDDDRRREAQANRHAFPLSGPGRRRSPALVRKTRGA
mgnify:CR=1 FL=1